MANQSQGHQSWFSYTLKRPYPFRWFTPTVIVGAFVAVIATSVFSVATTGYQLKSVTSVNPNATESSRTWLNNWPEFLVGSFRPSCEPTLISLGAQFYTNNTALPYTLSSITQDTGAHLGALVYKNNQLQNCYFTSVQYQFEYMELNAARMAVAQQGNMARGYIDCQIMTPQGISTVSLITSYTYVGDYESSLLPYFPSQNISSPTLYMGKSLLQGYWINLTYSFFDMNQDPANQYYKAVAILRPNYVNNTPPTDVDFVKSLGYFNATTFLAGFQANGAVPTHADVTDGNLQDLAKTMSTWQDLWLPMDVFGKSFIYTVYADLGQNDQLYPNILTNPALLEYFTAGLPEAVNSGIDHVFYPFWPLSTIQTPWTEAQNGSQYDLVINPSTFASSYICQIPVLKSTGALMFSVLVADLVFLQAIWVIFLIFVDVFFVKRLPPESSGTNTNSSINRSYDDDRRHLLSTPSASRAMPDAWTRNSQPSRRDYVELTDYRPEY